jgi:hypothetical protein
MRSAFLLLPSIIGLGCTSEPGGDPAAESAELRECANGRDESRGFSVVQAAVIVEIANTADARSLAVFLRADKVARLEQARPFHSLEAVACIPGVGLQALRDLETKSLGVCGLGDARPAAPSATYRACALWSERCGNESSTAEAPPQRACHSPAPQGRFVRDDRARGDALLPREIVFRDLRYVATYADGRLEEGRAQQRDKQRSPDGLFSYMHLRVDADPSKIRFFHMILDDGGTRLRLDPLVGPVGRESDAPTFRRLD